MLQGALPATKPSLPASCRRQRGLLRIRISPPHIPTGSSQGVFRRNLKYLHHQQRPRDSDTAAGAQGAEPGLSLLPPSLHRVRTPQPLAFVCSSNPHSNHSGARIKNCMGKISCFNHIWVAAARWQTRARCHPGTWCGTAGECTSKKITAQRGHRGEQVLGGTRGPHGCEVRGLGTKQEQGNRWHQGSRAALAGGCSQHG